MYKVQIAVAIVYIRFSLKFIANVNFHSGVGLFPNTTQLRASGMGCLLNLLTHMLPMFSLLFFQHFGAGNANAISSSK